MTVAAELRSESQRSQSGASRAIGVSAELRADSARSKVGLSSALRFLSSIRSAPGAAIDALAALHTACRHDKVAAGTLRTTPQFGVSMTIDGRRSDLESQRSWASGCLQPLRGFRAPSGASRVSSGIGVNATIRLLPRDGASRGAEHGAVPHALLGAAATSRRAGPGDAIVLLQTPTDSSLAYRCTKLSSSDSIPCDLREDASRVLRRSWRARGVSAGARVSTHFVVVRMIVQGRPATWRERC